MPTQKHEIAHLKKPFANRIVGHGEEAVDQLLANQLNFRLHPDNQQQALAGAIDDIGFIRSVTVNQRSGRVVDGHLRVTLAARSGVERLPVEYVDLDEAEEAQALVSLDPIAAMAASDRAKLDELLRTVQSDDARVQRMLAELAEKEGLVAPDTDGYNRSVQAPIYTPKEAKPAIADLYDETRTQELLAEIDAADLPEEEKEFLRIAARRHTVLHYQRIAEYYAHSSETVQRLMENSALVIIDFGRAIELGYVRLAEEIAAQYQEDYGPED